MGQCSYRKGLSKSLSLDVSINSREKNESELARSWIGVLAEARSQWKHDGSWHECARYTRYRSLKTYAIAGLLILTPTSNHHDHTQLHPAFTLLGGGTPLGGGGNVGEHPLHGGQLVRDGLSHCEVVGIVLETHNTKLLTKSFNRGIFCKHLTLFLRHKQAEVQHTTWSWANVISDKQPFNIDSGLEVYNWQMLCCNFSVVEINS